MMTRVQEIPKTSNGKRETLVEKLKILLFSMKILGMYHEPSSLQEVSVIDKQAFSEQQPIKGKICNHIFSVRTYSFVMLLFKIAATVSYSMSFLDVTDHEGVTAMRIGTFSWILQCAVLSIFYFISFQKKNRFQALNNHFMKKNDFESKEAVPDDFKDKEMVPDREVVSTSSSKHKRIVLILTCIAWVKTLLETTGISFFTLSDYVELIQHLSINPLPNVLPIRIVFSAIYGFAIGTWNFNSVYIISVCCCLNAEFKILNQSMEKWLQEKRPNALKEIEKYRLQHKQICDAVEIAERDFKYLISTSSTTNIFMFCFCAYVVINYNIPLPFLLILVAFSVVGVLYVFLIAIATANTHDMAHSALDHIYNIDVSDATVQQIAQMNLFISKLTANPIGFSFMGLMTVTKEFVLTLAGVLGTYFFLILQFRI